MNSKFKLYSMGTVARDLEEDEVYLEVYPTELLGSVDGPVGTSEKPNVGNTNISGNNISVAVDKATTLHAKWLPYGSSNRATPPNMCKGESVLIYNFADTDKYFWVPWGNDIDLRKQERVIYFFSAKESINTKDYTKHGYSITVDTKEKFISVQMSALDGEFTSYDFSLDAKEGLVSLHDGLGNEISLNSREGTFFTNLKNKIDFKAPHYSFSNGTHELLSVLVELLDANITETHIGNLGQPTQLTGGSKSKYLAIKNKLKSFL